MAAVDDLAHDAFVGADAKGDENTEDCDCVEGGDADLVARGVLRDGDGGDVRQLRCGQAFPDGQWSTLPGGICKVRKQSSEACGRQTGGREIKRVPLSDHR